MSFQTFVTQRLAALTAMINAISTNAKKIDELPKQDPLVATSKFHVSRQGISEYLEIQQIIDKASVSSISYGQLLIFKAISNNDPAKKYVLEIDDVACGFMIGGVFIPFGKYLGGNKQVITSWDTSPMWLPDDPNIDPNADPNP